jgi:16S rRNA processing protein RimM
LTQQLEVGRIARAHGLRGELMVDFVTDQIAARTAPGTVLSTDRGDLTVESTRPHQHRFLMRFVGIETREQADELAGRVLYADPIDDPEALWVHDLVGARVVDRSGQDRGRVVSVLANPAHPILELDSGALVPTVFVTGLVDGVVSVDEPDGLWE